MSIQTVLIEQWVEAAIKENDYTTYSNRAALLGYTTRFHQLFVERSAKTTPLNTTIQPVISTESRNIFLPSYIVEKNVLLKSENNPFYQNKRENADSINNISIHTAECFDVPLHLFLQQYPNVETLTIAGEGVVVESYEFAKYLPKCTSLELNMRHKTRDTINTLDFVTNMKELKYLHLHNVKLKTLKPLLQLANLITITLSGQVDEEAIASFKSARPEVSISIK